MSDLYKVTATELYGMDKEFVNQFITKHGPEAMALVVKALQLGFSKDLIMELVSWGNTLALELMVKLVQDWSPKAGAAPFIPGDLGDFKGMMVKKLLLMLVTQYGDEVLQYLKDLLSR